MLLPQASSRSAPNGIRAADRRIRTPRRKRDSRGGREVPPPSAFVAGFQIAQLKSLSKARTAPTTEPVRKMDARSVHGKSRKWNRDRSRGSLGLLERSPGRDARSGYSKCFCHRRRLDTLRTGFARRIGGSAPLGANVIRAVEERFRRPRRSWRVFKSRN